MIAIAWALFGLMAASLGVLGTALFAMFGRFDAVDARFDAMNLSSDRLYQRIDDLGTAIRGDLQVFDERLRRVGG
jgi:hypothetical protein